VELDGLHVGQTALRVEQKTFNYEFLRERSGRFRLDTGTYCVIPCMYSPDDQGEFMLRLATEKPAETGLVSEYLSFNFLYYILTCTLSCLAVNDV
jgi:hypothetical protein